MHTIVKFLQLLSVHIRSCVPHQLKVLNCIFLSKFFLNDFPTTKDCSEI